MDVSICVPALQDKLKQVAEKLFLIFLLFIGILFSCHAAYHTLCALFTHLRVSAACVVMQASGKPLVVHRCWAE